MQKLIVLLALLFFPVSAYAQGFGSPNGVGFPSSGSGSGGLTSPVGTADGGTGLTSYTAGDTVYYLSGGTFSKLAKGTAGQLYQMNSGATAPQWSTMSGDVTIAAGGATTIKSSVALAGSPTTTTQSANDNSTKIATTAYADRKMTNPMTTKGDMIQSSDGSGTPARLAIGKYDQQVSPNLTGSLEYSDRPVAPSVTTAELRVPWFAKAVNAIATALTAVGTNASASGTGTSQTSTDGIWVDYASAASTNNDAGFTGSDTTRFDAKPRFWARVKIVDTLVERFWCGFQKTGVVGSSADTISDSCGFRYNPATDVNGNIRFYTTNGATPTTTDTGVPFAAGVYQFTIDASNPSSYVGYIYTGGTLTTTTISTNLPTSTMVCTPGVLVRTLENVAKSVRIGGMFGDSI